MAEENRRLTGTLALSRLMLRLRLGVHSFERVEERDVPVDISRSGELFREGVPAVDYSRVCEAVAGGVDGEYLYIEHLAADILEILTGSFSGHWTVTVHKPFPPVNPQVESASVTVEG
ncbi:MAG TPA: dihydroneopterin aldolase [Candidatus Sabulitectum sp.]|nr:dihydroneopterin aldolase [Candidatus Sabulitectum sp.]HPF32608.1 dihydroneopterin aldolase [Candidatus Sabulitectum sp.]HPJ28182.1 dihydroneopterin aldolase [Candidatus Sabulitectum sp.]HPR21848.1 dihydroneopterin aldolase [Candidatus Sabulitectum sp.]